MIRFPSSRIGCTEDIEKEQKGDSSVRSNRSCLPSFQVRTDDLDHIVGGFFRGLGIARHVVADVIFHQFPHETVDGSAGGGEALENFGARVVIIEPAQNAFELANDLLRAVDEVEFFP